jgi:hypothetical protein
MSEPTPDQLAYVAGLQKRLHLPDHVLDGHGRRQFRRPFAELSRREVSWLLDEMTEWEQLPAELMRAKGQINLPGFG